MAGDDTRWDREQVRNLEPHRIGQHREVAYESRQQYQPDDRGGIEVPDSLRGPRADQRSDSPGRAATASTQAGYRSTCRHISSIGSAKVSGKRMNHVAEQLQPDDQEERHEQSGDHGSNSTQSCIHRLPAGRHLRCLTRPLSHVESSTRRPYFGGPLVANHNL